MPRHRHRDRWSSLCLWTLLTILLPAGIPAQAEPLNRPFWAEQAMFRFGEDLFFVGQASCAKRAEEGRQKAFTQGLQELLNHAQASSLAGVEIATQMVFEESSPSGCPPGTVTVWRLLRVDADKVTKLAKAARFRLRLDAPPPAAPPRDLTPKMGMSRDETLDRFGRPWSILMRESGEEIGWEYPQFGLTLMLNRDNYVKGWRLAAPQEREKKEGPGVGEQSPVMDLTDRLGRLERSSEALTNVVYNKDGFSVPVRRFQPSETLFPETTIHITFSSRPFLPTTQTVTGLAAGEYSNGLKVSMSIGPRCDFAVYNLSIWPLAEATGPQISADHHLSDSANAELHMAVALAARTIGYDPRYLGVRVSLYTPIFPLQSSDRVNIDISGAGVVFAVTIASAILGDPVRSEISMFGTLDGNLTVEPIDDLEDRISGCRQHSPRELVLPVGQNYIDRAVRRMGDGIKVTYVTTLPEAYRVATGQPLRLAQ